MRLISYMTAMLMIAVVTSTCLAEEFPYRRDYPEVRTIGLEELKDLYDKDEVILVDVRSTFEYETIHPRGAFHVSLAKASFISDLRSLMNRFPGKMTVVYCNGITCLKSYKATQEAMDAGLKNVFAFDAGISTWARKYPSETLLLGREVVDPDQQLISQDAFEKHTLDFDTFKRRVKSSENVVVIDVRDPIQRTEELPGFEKAMPIPLDKMIRNLINKGHMKNRQLFIFDQVGKQVRWLMYYLEDKGYTDYYFLAGGATAVLHEQVYR